MIILQQTRANLSSGDQLALDLPFAETKSLTARIGPNPVFSRASTGTFVGSNGLIQSAATNIPRFDHTSAGVCRGLLIEESRTNLALQSENHPSASWSKTGLTVASVSHTSPDGSTISNLAREDSSTGMHRLFQATAYVSGTSYSISVFLKFAGRQFVAITFPAVADNGIAIFDIQNGTIPLTQSGVTSSITAYPNGWYRCVVNGISSISASSSHIIQGSATGNFVTGSYTGLNGPAFYIYGSQVEAGSFATSYIPTTTASAVRSADVCSITGANFTSFYNQSEGTIIGQGIVDTVGIGLLFPYFASFNDGTANNRVVLGATNSAGSGVRPIVVAAGSTSFTNTIGTSSAGQSRKVGMVYKQNDFIAAHNGTLTAADNTGNVPSVVDRVSFDGPFFVGTIAAIRYYKKRLPNAKLAQLTV